MLKSIRASQLEKVLLVILFIFLLSPTLIRIIRLVLNITSFSLAHNSYNEVRDFISFRLTNFIINGENPYTVDFPNKTNVPFMLLYTGLQPLVVAILCFIAKLDIVTGYYIINIVFVLLTSINIWLILKEYFQKYKYKYIAALCVLINVATFFSLFGLPIFNLHTDTIGIYFTSLIFLIVDRQKENTLILAILSVLLIFTKQVLIVLALPLFLYYCIVNKKLAIKYFIQCCICGLIAIFTVQLLFPLYWTETIYAQYFVSKNYGNFLSALLNICYFYYRYAMYIILIIIGCIGIFHCKNHTFSLCLIQSHDKYVVYLFLNIFIGTISLLYFAKCGEDGYKYCQDILAPSLFMFAIYSLTCGINCLSKEINALKEKELHIFALFLLCVSTIVVYSNFASVKYTNDDKEAYEKLNDIIASHNHETMYLGINSTQYMLTNKILEEKTFCFDDGQIEYFVHTPSSSNALFYGDVLHEAATQYVKKVNDMVQKQKFGLIITCIDRIINPNILVDKYYMSDKIPIKTEANISPFEVSIWIPK